MKEGRKRCCHRKVQRLLASRYSVAELAEQGCVLSSRGHSLQGGGQARVCSMQHYHTLGVGSVSDGLRVNAHGERSRPASTAFIIHSNRTVSPDLFEKDDRPDCIEHHAVYPWTLPLRHGVMIFFFVLLVICAYSQTQGAKCSFEGTSCTSYAANGPKGTVFTVRHGETTGVLHSQATL